MKYKPRQNATKRRIRLDTGDVFGCWTVICETGEKSVGSRHIYWICECICGTRRDIPATVLKCGRSTSCGCIGIERSKQVNRKHGLSDSYIYRTWRNMVARCTRKSDKDYPRYGARGISVCSAWLSFDNFFRDIGHRPTPEHTLGRINNDGPYAPDNVRWETPMQQANNRRSSRRITIDGETKTAAQWARIAGISQTSLMERIGRGMPPREAISTPRRDTRG